MLVTSGLAGLAIGYQLNLPTIRDVMREVRIWLQRSWWDWLIIFGLEIDQDPARSCHYLCCCLNQGVGQSDQRRAKTRIEITAT